MRLTTNLVIGAVAAVSLAVLLSPAQPVLGGEGGPVLLSIGDGQGQAGGDADVTLSLDNDDDSAVSASVDIEFNDADLTFTTPVSSSCTLDPRIASTHQVGGRIIEPGVVAIEIFVAGTPDPLPPLGNGALGVCTFGIRADATEGDMFPLGATNVLIGDASGGEIDSTSDDGVITVVGPEATATVTDTPEDGTPTVTATPEPTTPSETPGTPGTPGTPATMVPTEEPTEEPTEGPTPSDESFALTVNPASQTGVQGGTVAIEVVLSSDPSGEAADSVVNTLAAGDGLTVTECTIAGEIPGTIEGVPGTTATATLGDGEDSVPSGTVYSCDVAVAEDATGSIAIDCTDATADGEEITCSGSTVVVDGGPQPTPTEVPPTVPPTNTATVPPTATHTNTPVLDSDDDGCAVGPVDASDSPLNSLVFLLVPAALLWRRRR